MTILFVPTFQNPTPWLPFVVYAIAAVAITLQGQPWYSRGLGMEICMEASELVLNTGSQPYGDDV